MSVTAWCTPRTVTGTGWTASDAGTLLHAVTVNELSVYATHNAPVTDVLYCTNFDFGLTGTETIEGLEIRITCAIDLPIALAGQLPGLLVKGTADSVTLLGTGSDCYPLSTTMTQFTLGGPLDTLGNAWAGIDVGGNPLFGFGMKASTDVSYIEAPARKRRIDYVEARVHYSAATSVGGVMGSRHFKRIPDFGQIRNPGMVVSRSR